MIAYQHMCLFDRKTLDSMSFNSLGCFLEELTANEEISFTTFVLPKILVVKTFQFYSIDFLGIHNRLIIKTIQFQFIHFLSVQSTSFQSRFNDLISNFVQIILLSLANIKVILKSILV